MVRSGAKVEKRDVNWCETIRNHYRSAWGTVGIPHTQFFGRAHELPADFHVLKLPPHRRDMWTYATCCMSQPEDETGLELHMFSPVEIVTVPEILAMTAHFHRAGATLGLGHSVNFGMPWLPLSECTYGLISLPYLDGPSLETLEHGGKVVKFGWLIPVTEREVEYKKRHGLEALEQAFEAAESNYLDPRRASVV